MSNELIVNHGIFQTQVKSLLTTISKRYGNSYQIHLLSLTPLLRLRKWYVEFVFSKYRTEFKTITSELQKSNLYFNVKPLLSAYPFLSMNFFELLLFLPGALWWLFLYIKKHHIDFLHCRSYSAGLLGLLIKLIMGIPYIFDPRSLWIEEQILIGAWKRGSLIHKFWLLLQQHIVSNAKRTVVVSDTMVSYYKHLTPNIEVIYTTASDIFFRSSPSQIPDSEKDKIVSLKQMKQCHTLLVFSTNRFNQWNNLDYLLQKYKTLRNYIPKPRLVIISRTSKNIIINSAQKHNISLEEIWAEEFTIKTMKTALSLCHYGLLVMPNFAFMNSIMSIKFAEYLASGLPVICDPHLGGAAHVINQHNVGMLITNNKSDNRIMFKNMNSSYAQISHHCKSIAKKLFSVDAHAKKYVTLYRDIII